MRAAMNTTRMRTAMSTTGMRPYIQPTTETVDLRLTYPFLDGIGIHHSLGLDEDAANKAYLDLEDEDAAADPFFYEEEGF